MSEPIKFSNEELEKIKKIQDDYLEIQNLFGQVSLSRLRLQEQIQLLDKKDEENKQKFSDVQKNEKQFYKEQQCTTVKHVTLDNHFLIGV